MLKWFEMHRLPESGTPEKCGASMPSALPFWIRALKLGVAGACATVIAAFGIWAVFFILHPPFSGVTIEFTGLSGKEASERLERIWPAGIDPVEVRSVDHKYASTIDSHSSWNRIELPPDAAEKWCDHAHLQQERCYADQLGNPDEVVEGVHRTVHGPPPLHRQTGTTPAWWRPPAGDYRATELMKWYRGYDSGVGRATYTAYDEAANVLWIYEYSCQHDILWSKGSVPAGRQFSSIKQSD